MHSRAIREATTFDVYTILNESRNADESRTEFLLSPNLPSKFDDFNNFFLFNICHIKNIRFLTLKNN